MVLFIIFRRRWNDSLSNHGHGSKSIQDMIFTYVHERAVVKHIPFHDQMCMGQTTHDVKDHTIHIFTLVSKNIIHALKKYIIHYTCIKMNDMDLKKLVAYIVDTMYVVDYRPKIQKNTTWDIRMGIRIPPYTYFRRVSLWTAARMSHVVFFVANKI
jgi:hypothetical protein